MTLTHSFVLVSVLPVCMKQAWMEICGWERGGGVGEAVVIMHSGGRRGVRVVGGGRD